MKCKNCGCDESHHKIMPYHETMPDSGVYTTCSNCHKRIEKYNKGSEQFEIVFIHECREFES